MMAERHSGPLNKVQADTAGNAADCASVVHSNVPWWQLGSGGGLSQRNKELFMMRQTDGWMSGCAGGGMWLWMLFQRIGIASPGDLGRLPRIWGIVRTAEY
jgi:hypothetical protein